MTESQKLLAEYAENGSETAFRELVARYISLVYSTALRLVGGDTQAAEDVAQTVFINLARRGRTLSKAVMLGGWLHQHTFHVATKAMRAERRRQTREREALEMNLMENDSGANLREVAPILDEAITQLGREDRTAILLRFFEQRDFRAVGAALGSNEDAARMRVSRALEKLHGILKRRGVTLSAAALGTALAGEAITAAPTRLAASVAGTALASATASGGISVPLTKLMATTKLKLGILSGVVVFGVATSVMIQHQAQAKLRQTDASIREQSAQVSRLQADNQRLDSLLHPAANSVDDLVQARNEVAALRSQAGAAQDENRILQAALFRAQIKTNSLVWQPDGLMAEAKDKVTYCKLLGLAMHQYAANHQELFPTNFAQAAAEVASATKGQTNFTSDQFEIVYRGSRQTPNYARDIILIRERQPWKTAAGQWAKVYTQLSGGATALCAVDGTFEVWEKQNIIPPDSTP